MIIFTVNFEHKNTNENQSSTMYIYKRESNCNSDRFTPKLMDQSGRMMALLKGCIMLSVL